MPITVHSYSLPDHTLFEDANSTYRYLIWRPRQICIVLGKSNKALDESVFVEAVREDSIPIYQRATGGQAVVLTPQMLAISITENGPSQLRSQQYFRLYNEKIIAALKSLGIDELEYKGISDIVLNGRKVAGTAMYRNPNKIFYHAILNIGQDPEIFEKYLTYPKKVPEYRQGRSHREFVTSLQLEGYDIAFDAIESAIAAEIGK